MDIFLEIIKYNSKPTPQGSFDYLQTRETERMPTVAELNEDTRKYLKRNEWNGPILYDSYGLIKIPTDKELFRYKSMRIIDDIGKDAIDKLLQWRRKEHILTPHYDEAYWETVKYHKNAKPY